MEGTYGEPNSTAQHPLSDVQAQSNERTYSTLMHLCLFALPFFWIPVVPALVMWLVKRDSSPFINDHGKEAVNFQISLTIYGCIATVLMKMCIGFALLPAVVVFGIVGAIMAAVAANKGRYFRYPACLRLIS